MTAAYALRMTRSSDYLREHEIPTFRTAGHIEGGEMSFDLEKKKYHLF
jgi:hypothetical protein